MDPQRQHLAMMDARTRGQAYVPGEDFPAWQARAREALAKRLGMDTFSRCDPEVRVEWTRREEGFAETRFRFRTEENYEAIAHLLVPDGAHRPPTMICLQGHSKGMHISLGRAKFPGDEQTIAGGDRDFALQAVARGYAALALEQRGFGECGGTEKGPACQQPAMAALLLGRTLVGERVWDVCRAIDVLEAAFAQVDSTRVGLVGNSGGGTTIIYAAALEPRVAAAMPSCAFSGFQESIGAQLHCTCNYVPGVMRDFDMGDIAALAAPRPLVIVNGVEDGIFPIQAARAQFEIAQAAYRAAGAPGNARHVVGGEGHRFYADLAWPVFKALTGW